MDTEPFCDLFSRKDLASWIPARLATPDSYDFLVESIVDEYTRLEGTSIAKAKVQYLESIRKFALYGSAIFPVKVKTKIVFASDSLTISKNISKPSMNLVSWVLGQL